jgi:integrator complex subunit 1
VFSLSTATQRHHGRCRPTVARSRRNRRETGRTASSARAQTQFIPGDRLVSPCNRSSLLAITRSENHAVRTRSFSPVPMPTNTVHWSTRNDASTASLGWKDVPAFEAVAKRPELFRALVCCLAKRSSVADTTEAINAPGSRKRSMSITEPLLKKNGVSPLPSQRSVYETAKKKPTFDEPVFAATVLFNVFQHLKHWPAPLVKAYADDSFGPRLWVDNPRCSLFVESLALVHKETSFPAILMDEKDEARLMAEAYRDFYDSAGLQRHVPIEHQLSSSLLGTAHSFKRQASTTSSGSISGDNGITTKRPRVATPSNGDSAGGSEGDLSFGQSLSGDEDVQNVTKRKREIFDQENSDYEQLNEAKSASSLDDEDAGAGDEKNLYAYPLGLSVIMSVAKPPHRFLGSNTDAARRLIATSLEERLDVKAKQNSGLLQCLPDFVAIPAVRQQVGANIERWLQSPALAGLARALLGETVKNMENVNPPLAEDLTVVDAVLGMKLKSNQVSVDFSYRSLVCLICLPSLYICS